MFADVKDFDGFYHCALAFWHHYINRQVRIKETKEEKDKLLLGVAFCVMGFANITSSKVRKHCLIKLFKQTHVRSLAIKINYSSAWSLYQSDPTSTPLCLKKSLASAISCCKRTASWGQVGNCIRPIPTINRS